MAGYLQVLVGKVPGSVHMEQNLGVEVELLVVLDGLEEGLCVPLGDLALSRYGALPSARTTTPSSTMSFLWLLNCTAWG